MSGYSSELVQTRGPHRHPEPPNHLSPRKTPKGTRMPSSSQTQRFPKPLTKLKSLLLQVQQHLHLHQHQQSSNKTR